MSTVNGLSILLIDDHSMFNESLRTMIAKHLPEIPRIDGARSSDEAWHKLHEWAYSLVLLDIRLASDEKPYNQQGQQLAGGLQLCGRICQQYPACKVLMLSAYSENYFVQQARMLGAKGYLLKELPVSMLIVGIRRVLNGDSYFDPTQFHCFEQSEIEEQISYLHPRIIEMLLAFLDGQGPSNQELAAAMGLREKTIRNYMSQAYDQLDIHSRSKLLLWLQSHEIYLRQAASQ